MLDITEVKRAFPAKEYRPYQYQTLSKMTEAFNSGVKCILLEAPTGMGKSYVNATFCKLMKSFYATPQLSLIDQLLHDINLRGYFVEIKGRQNYPCVCDPPHTCDLCKTVRDKTWKCDKYTTNPYWMQKMKALEANTALMSFTYLMLEGFTDTPYSFGHRKLLVLDEAHSIDRHAVEHLGFQVSPYTVTPQIFTRIESYLHEYRSVEQVRTFIEYVLDLVEPQLQSYDLTLDGKVATEKQAKDMLRLQDFKHKAEQFLETQPFTEWIWQLSFITLKDVGVRKRFILQPLYAKRFMGDLIWKKADLFIISSATILDAKQFIAENGLESVLRKDEILYLQVPSTFPPENRKMVDMTVGKMTRNYIDETLPKLVTAIEKIIELEKGKNIAIHCHSYKIATAIEKALRPKYGGIIIAHESTDRADALERWKHSKGKIFVSVAFEEGQDWVGDTCGAQIIVKAPFPDITDRRVAKRLEYKQWRWYWTEALKKSIQTYGRAVRASDEVKYTYVLDESFFQLISRCWKSTPQWFKDALPPQRNKDVVRNEAK